MLIDPELARNDYYSVFQGGTAPEDFWKKHLKKKNPSAEILEQLKSIMESQRFSQLMFTSCGWFFADISGIETVQIIKYANTAICYAKHYSEVDLEAPFLQKLSLAVSNVGPEYNGNVIYTRWIKPFELDEAKALNQYMMEGEMFQEFGSRHIFLYELTPLENISFNAQEEPHRLIRVQLKHIPTGRASVYVGLLIRKQVEFQTWVSPLSALSLEDVQSNLQTLLGPKRKGYLSTLFSIKMGISDLNYESSRHLMDYLWGKKEDLLLQSLDGVFEDFKDLIQSTQMMGGLLPPHVRGIVEILLITKYEEALRKIRHLTPDNIASVEEIVETAHGLRIMIKKDQ
jgi:hypothetical protein